MMQLPTITIIHKLFLAILIFGGIAFGVHFFIENKIRTTYQTLVSNGEIVDAFLSNDTVAIQEVADRYRVEYQEIQQGRVIFTSDDDLPIPKIVSVQTKFAPEVLAGDTSDILRALAPLRMIKNGRLYVGASIFSDMDDAPGYIIYKQVLP